MTADPDSHSDSSTYDEIGLPEGLAASDEESHVIDELPSPEVSAGVGSTHLPSDPPVDTDAPPDSYEFQGEVETEWSGEPPLGTISIDAESIRIPEPPFRWRRDQTVPVPFEQLVVADNWNRQVSDEDARYDRDLGFELYGDPKLDSRGYASRIEAYYISPMFQGGTALVWRERKQEKRRLGGEAHVELERYLDLEYWVDGMILALAGPSISRLAFRVASLSDKLKALPDTAARQSGIRRLYQIAQYLLGLLEGAMQPSDEPSDEDIERNLAAMDEIDVQLTGVDSFYEAVYARIGEGYYVRGMFRGLLYMLILAILIAILAPASLEWVFDVNASGPRFQALLASMVAGSLGGVLSVMMRFSKGRLTIRQNVDMKRIRQLGMFRPVVGSMFAVAINVIVLAGLVPQLTIGPEVAFFAAVGFIAGFSERWAQDMVAVAQSNLPSPVQ